MSTRERVIESRLSNYVSGPTFVVVAKARQRRDGLMYAVETVSEVTISSAPLEVGFTISEDDTRELITLLTAALQWRQGT